MTIRKTAFKWTGFRLAHPSFARYGETTERRIYLQAILSLWSVNFLPNYGGELVAAQALLLYLSALGMTD